MKTAIFFPLALLLLISPLYGQIPEPKFGKIEIAEMNLSRYEKDTTADALILFDNGRSYFTLGGSNKFKYTFERHFRIKIFKKTAYDLANLTIRLNSSGSSSEKLIELKGATYNLEGGKIVKTKLNTDKVYKQVSKNHTDNKFAFPDVREGSIIEISYSISSELLYNFRGWTFQHSYPALWSQYSYKIPEYFTYRQTSKGYLPFDINSSEITEMNFIAHNDSEAAQGLGGQRSSSNDVNIRCLSHEVTLATKNVPAFISEQNTDCDDNYVQSLEFELGSTRFPNEQQQNYTQSWESVNDQMNKDEIYGALLHSDRFIRDTTMNLIVKAASELERAKIIYSYVQSRMKWDESYNLWSRDGLEKPFLNLRGNSSEINLLLTLMLRTAGLKADPVMYSTRSNGNANTIFPTISKFNSTLVVVLLDGKQVLLDASEKYCPFGVLPANDLNGRGRVVNGSSGDWVNLDPVEKHKEVKLYVMDITSDGRFKGRIVGNYYGYAGMNYRRELDRKKSSADYVKELQVNTNGLEINKYSLSNTTNFYRPLVDTFHVEISDHADFIGNKILFKPLLLETIEKNKYTLEERKYPVNYNFQISEAYYYEFTIPAGYEVESLPESELIRLPDNSISVSYAIQKADNKIKLTYKRTVNKVEYLPEEYPNLKELYDRIVKKHAEQVILKKII